MSLIRSFSLLAVGLWAGCAVAQVSITVTAPVYNVLVNGNLQLTPSITDLVGTPLDTSSLLWASSDGSIAAVSSSGLVTGLFPGDITIGVADANTGVSIWTPIHVVPASVSVQASPSQFHVGEKSLLTAVALDAMGKAIPGVNFAFLIGQPGIASVGNDGSATGVAEGFTTIEAHIVGVGSDPALVATTPIHVLPRPAYQITKLLSTDAPSTTTIAGFSQVSAVSPGEVAAVVSLANGGQAAVLIEGGQTKVLAVVGQNLPNTKRMVQRIDAISANSKGDVAMLLEYPSQFCSASVVLFPHGQAEQEIAPANCSNAIKPHSLGEDGTVLYRINGDQIYLASATAAPKLLFSIATQPKSNDPVVTVVDFAAGGGTFMLNAYLKSGAHVYLWSEGTSLAQAYKDGDQVRGKATISMDLPVGSADGTFFARVNGNGFEALVQAAPGALKPLMLTTDSIPGGTLGWIHSLTDANSGGVLFAGDFNTNGTYHTGMAVWKAYATAESSLLAGYGAIMTGALLTNGAAAVSAALPTDTNVPPLRSIAKGGNVSVILASAVPFPQSAPPGVDWHFSSRGESGSSGCFRGAGESIVTVDSSIHSLMQIGSPLPNSKLATWLGTTMADELGNCVFTAGYPTGSVLMRYRAGKMELLQDSSVAKTGPGGSSVTYFFNGRGRYLALSNRGDAVNISQYNSGATAEIVVLAPNGPALVAAANTAAPGGGTFVTFQTVAVDDNGHVLFTAVISDGKTAVFYWDGKTVTRLVGVGDAGVYGYTVNEISNISGGGSSFAIVLALGNYQYRELRTFDGQQMRSAVTTDLLLDATALNYFWYNEATVSANGDLHYQAGTQDSGAGIYAHRVDGTNPTVARTRDPLPGGEWMIMPLDINSGPAGQVYFTAYTIHNGVEALGLYLAIPQ